MSGGRAAIWFENVEQFDKDLRDFELAESVRKVSQPPKSERYRDRWNNVKLSQPKPGDYFNRRTCSWYVDSKKKDIVLLQGLCAFAKEDYAKAKEHWDKLSELDKEFYTQQKADEAMKAYLYFAPGGVLEKTVSAPRALMNFAGYTAQSTRQNKNFEQGIKCYEYLYENFPATKQGEYALFYLADCYARSGDRPNAVKYSNLYLEKYPKGGYNKHIEIILEK